MKAPRTLGRSPLSLIAIAVCLGLLLGGCAAGQADLAAFDRKIDVEGFMGDWYVLAFIPIDLPFFSEARAHDAVERYELRDGGRIDVTYTFRDGGFDVPPTVMRQKARIYDEDLGTAWRVRIFWPFESAYLIAWLDERYERAIIGVPSRSNVWILSRRPDVSKRERAALTARVAELGYDPSLLIRVPHRDVTD